MTLILLCCYSIPVRALFIPYLTNLNGIWLIWRMETNKIKGIRLSRHSPRSFRHVHGATWHLLLEKRAKICWGRRISSKLGPYLRKKTLYGNQNYWNWELWCFLWRPEKVKNKVYSNPFDTPRMCSFWWTEERV